MSHQQTITVGFDDRYYNIPTVWNGKKVSNEEATTLARQRLKQGGSFDNFATQEEATKSAGEVSENQGRMANKKLATITMPDGRTADIFGPEDASKEDIMAKVEAAKSEWTAAQSDKPAAPSAPAASAARPEKPAKKGFGESVADLLGGVNSFLGTNISEPVLAIADLGKTIVTGALGQVAGGFTGGAGALMPGPENQAGNWAEATQKFITQDLWTKPGERLARQIGQQMEKKVIPPFWRAPLPYAPFAPSSSLSKEDQQRVRAAYNENLGNYARNAKNKVSVVDAGKDLDDFIYQVSGGNAEIATGIRTFLYGAPEVLLGRTPFKGTPALQAAKEIGERSATLKAKVAEVEAAAEKAGYKLTNDELPDSVVAVADAMAPERHAAANVDEIQMAVQKTEQDLSAAVDALYKDARSRKAIVDIEPLQKVVGDTVQQLQMDGFDIARMDKLPLLIKDFENLQWIKKSGNATEVDLNGVMMLERRLTETLRGKSRGKYSSEDVATMRLRNAVRGHMDDVFNRGAITGDPKALDAWKNARGKASQLARFNEDRLIRNLVREDASPEMVYRWLVGASGMGAKKESVRTIRRLKEILGDDHPSLVSVRNAVLRDVLTPAFADSPNFKKLIVNIDKLVLENPSLMKELAIPTDELLQMKAAAHAALKTRAPLPEWANRSWVVRRSASVLFGHQIARKGAIVQGAHKIMDYLFGTGVLTKKEIVDHLTKHKYAEPMVVPKSPLWADIMVRGAIADLSDETDDEAQGGQ